MYAYEEAIGHCVDPAAVRDKDGISAAVLVRSGGHGEGGGRAISALLDGLRSPSRCAPAGVDHRTQRRRGGG